MIINAHCLNGAKCNTHIMIINAQCLSGAKWNTCLGPLNPHWSWGFNALFAYGYEKINLQRNIEYEISMQRYKNFIYGGIFNEI